MFATPEDALPTLGTLFRPAHMPAPARGNRQDEISSSLLNPFTRYLLDAVGTGLLLVDADAGVCFANRSAQAHCHGGALLELADGQLHLSCDHRQRLLVALRQAQRGQWSMLVLRQGSRRLALGVVPMLFQPGPQATVAAALLLGSGAQPGGLALQFFSQAHGLTGAESAVLAALCRGLKPAQIAKQGGVAISTVRTQVAALRAKTQASDIGDLLSQVYNLPPLAPQAPTAWR